MTSHVSVRESTTDALILKPGWLTSISFMRHLAANEHAWAREVQQNCNIWGYIIGSADAREKYCIDKKRAKWSRLFRSCLNLRLSDKNINYVTSFSKRTCMSKSNSWENLRRPFEKHQIVTFRDTRLDQLVLKTNITSTTSKIRSHHITQWPSIRAFANRSPKRLS